MSQARHRLRDTALVRTFGLSPAAGTFEPPAAPGWDRLILASGARAVLRAADRVFPLVAGSGVWVPAGRHCALDLRERGEIRVAYMRVSAGAGRRSEVGAVAVSPLLRELVAEAIARGAFDGRVARERRLALVLFDEVANLRSAALSLPLPQSGAARAVADRLLADPSLPAATRELARLASCSVRTLERAFAADVGLGVAVWRRRLRMLHGLQLVGNGLPVTEAALEAGYAGASAFCAAFRREFGTSPRGFFARVT